VRRGYDCPVPATRVVLITGCSSPQGIGFATARRLAQDGHEVHATVRDHAHDAELRDGFEDRLLIHDLDLRDGAQITAVVGEIENLEVLINNAGYGLIGGIEQTELSRVRENFETNLFATVALIQEVLPRMRERRGGHIVNVTTIFATGLCLPAVGYYAASKAALETVGQALAIEAATWNVRVTNFQPGPVMTDLSREWGTRLQGADDPRPGLSDELSRWVSGDGPTPQSPSQVAEALCRVIEREPPGIAQQSGDAARSYVGAALHDPTRAGELMALLDAFAQTSPGGGDPTRSPAAG
jgi:NAD(P)-dependent dehydrogenase (short-subunit alcohol dehydrogenase family)